MKKDIHPDYHTIKVQMLDSSQFTTKSTWGSKDKVLVLSNDITNHPAWTGVTKLINRGNVAKFNKRFSSFGLNKEQDSKQ